MKVRYSLRIIRSFGRIFYSLWPTTVSSPSVSHRGVFTSSFNTDISATQCGSFSDRYSAKLSSVSLNSFCRFTKSIFSFSNIALSLCISRASSYWLIFAWSTCLKLYLLVNINRGRRSPKYWVINSKGSCYNARNLFFFYFVAVDGWI